MKLRWRDVLIGTVALLAATPFVAPEALAFPYHEDFGTDRVWSVQPIDRVRMAETLAQANRLVAASPIARSDEGRRIFLTDGGWRWTVLALQSSFAFAVSPRLRDDVIINRSDLPTGRVHNGLGDGRTRSLAGIIAHEKCHGMERNRFGSWVDLTRPVWLREGYCDYVAQESTLTDAEVEALRKSNRAHPALPYYEGRKRVAAILARNGGNVDELFARY